MANYSSAAGTMRITGTLDQAKYIVSTLEEHTEFFATSDIVEISNNFYHLQFTATGRWTYESNLMAFFDTLYSFAEQSSDPNELIKFKKLIMDDDNLKIQFDYCDEESGCAVLYYQRCNVQPFWEKKGVVRTFHQVFDEICYDYNRKNLLELGFYEDDQIYDYTIDGIKAFFSNKINEKEKKTILKELTECLENQDDVASYEEHDLRQFVFKNTELMAKGVYKAIDPVVREQITYEFDCDMYFDEDFMEAFVTAFNKYLSNKKAVA